MHEVECLRDHVAPNRHDFLEFPVVHERAEPGRQQVVHVGRDAHHDFVLRAERRFRHLRTRGDALDGGAEATEADELNLVTVEFKRGRDVTRERKDVQRAHRTVGQTRSAAHNNADRRT